MPLPARTPSTRIPNPATVNATPRRDASPTKQPATTDRPRLAFPRRDSHSQSSAGALSSSSRLSRQISQPREIPTASPPNGTSGNGTTSQSASSHGNGGASLVRAKSLRQAAATAQGPPSSFKMPARPLSTATAPTQASANRGHATAPTQASVNRGHTRQSSVGSTIAEKHIRSPSLGRSQSTTSRRSSFNDPHLSTPHTEPRPRPPLSTFKRPISASSNSTPTSARKQPFSTHQQQFESPTKQPPPGPPAPTAKQLRQQTHLLHLSLLHASAEPELQRYSASARRQLSQKHQELQDLYLSSLRLSRAARQQRNLLALTKWTDGNVAVLERKLSALCTVLEEISRLTIPVPHHRTDIAPHDPQEDGPYAKLVEQFTAWVGYVLGVWEERDAATEREANGTATDEEQDQDTFTPIDGLGDGIKASVRQLSDTVNALLTRMEDVRATKVPDVDISDLLASRAGPDADAVVAHSRKRTQDPATPASLVAYAGTLLDIMAEELQLIREIEFEVVIGEKAWVEDRMRRAQAEIDGGFGTPTVRSFRDVF